MFTPAERTAIAAAEVADKMAENELEGHTVEVWIKDRRFAFPAAATVPSAVEEFLEHQIVLCPGCRS